MVREEEECVCSYWNVVKVLFESLKLFFISYPIYIYSTKKQILALY
jgi:hypothetical protein